MFLPYSQWVLSFGSTCEVWVFSRHCLLVSVLVVLCLFGFNLAFSSIGHTRMDNCMCRGNQYMQLVKVLYIKLMAICTKLPTFPNRVWELNHRPQRWEASVLQLCHHSTKFEELLITADYLYEWVWGLNH